MPGEGGALSGRGVLVTRPAQQAERLARMLAARGARVLRFPLIEIGPPADPNAGQAALARIAENHWAIFVSANAARFAATLLPDFPSRVGRCRVACVGEATADALERLGIVVEAIPEDGTSSEALLALEAFEPERMAGRRIAIIKGEGGRGLLEGELRDRGARVTAVDVYRRQPPRGDLPAFLDAHRDELDLAVITSGEALARFARVAGAERAAAMPLVLPSERVRRQAASLGLGGPFVVARHMSDDELAAAADRLAAEVTGR